MTAPESLRDEIIEVLADADPCCDIDCYAGHDHAAYLTDALLASPILARVIREAKAEVLREAADRIDSRHKVVERRHVADALRDSADWIEDGGP